LEESTWKIILKIKFLGATGTVTGSKYLLTIQNKHILVDCGLFQGFKELRLRNWDRLPIAPADIDAVVLTHAHIDHTGYIPLLVKNGFKGTIYATKPTCDLCAILLPDSGYLQEEDARSANLHGYSKHHPALPLYTMKDAEKSLEHFKPMQFSQDYTLAPGIQVSWHRAGHILGAAFVQFEVEGKTLLFSGDIGRFHDPIMKAPEIMRETDYLVLESTYGNRLHEKSDPKDSIAKVVVETIQRGGTVLIPAFAVGRAQSILYYLAQLKKEKRIPDVPIFLDSPMAIDATLLLQHYSDKETHLTPEQCRMACSVASYINTVDESKELDEPSPKIIVAASGMMTGGRVLHHLKTIAPDPRNTILMTGYQAGGTRGADLLAGGREIKIHGEIIAVKAQVVSLNSLSAHADYEDILYWLKQFKRPPRKVFITHGEPEAADALKKRIEKELGWSCEIPTYLEEVTLG
jgi:metallo-beta-lactamase family protein